MALKRLVNSILGRTRVATCLESWVTIPATIKQTKPAHLHNSPMVTLGTLLATTAVYLEEVHLYLPHRSLKRLPTEEINDLWDRLHIRQTVNHWFSNSPSIKASMSLCKPRSCDLSNVIFVATKFGAEMNSNVKLVGVSFIKSVCPTCPTNAIAKTVWKHKELMTRRNRCLVTILQAKCELTVDHSLG